MLNRTDRWRARIGTRTSWHGLPATRCITASRSANVCRSHVLRTEADPDQPGRNSPQNWPMAQELQRSGKGQRFGVPKNPPNHGVLYDDLEPLCGSSRKVPSPLDGMKFAFRGSFLQKSWA
jgi:hypothetical protein